MEGEGTVGEGGGGGGGGELTMVIDLLCRPEAEQVGQGWSFSDGDHIRKRLHRVRACLRQVPDGKEGGKRGGGGEEVALAPV
eukprot:12309-Hanusia_phi.AAC.1